MSLRATCPECDGAGTVESESRLGDSIRLEPCNRCDERGWVALCPRCNSTYLRDDDDWMEPCHFCIADEYRDLKWSDEDGDRLASQRKDDNAFRFEEKP